MIGITDVCGRGKSVLVCKLAEKLRGNGGLLRGTIQTASNFLVDRRSNTIISGGKNQGER
jgi:hypothetical protein